MTTCDPNAPILVLDSGLGGLTVARALRRRLPGEKLLYFGDTARVPYGTKSASGITACVTQIVNYLRDYEPKHVVVACNSASAVALPALRDRFPDLNISGVIEPGARAAARAAGEKLHCTVAVVATEATVRSRAYERAIVRRRMKARVVQRPTPLLVPMVEEGRGDDDPLVEMVLEEYLTPAEAVRAGRAGAGLHALPDAAAGLRAGDGRGVQGHRLGRTRARRTWPGRLESAGLLRPTFGRRAGPAAEFAPFRQRRVAPLRQAGGAVPGRAGGLGEGRLAGPAVTRRRRTARTLHLPQPPARRSAC